MRSLGIVTDNPTPVLSEPTLAVLSGPLVLMDTKESGELIRMSERSIRRKHADGLLPGYRSHPGNGGKLLFRRADVLALVGIVEEQPPTIPPPLPRRPRKAKKKAGVA